MVEPAECFYWPTKILRAERIARRDAGDDLNPN
jgi:hypothetical protein